MVVVGLRVIDLLGMFVLFWLFSWKVIIDDWGDELDVFRNKVDGEVDMKVIVVMEGEVKGIVSVCVIELVVIVMVLLVCKVL